MKIRFTRAAAAAGLAVCATASPSPLTALLRAHKFVEVERMADARLASDPDDADALAAKVDAIVALEPERRADEAVALGERCVAARPLYSGCYLASGIALGAKARHAGPVAAMGYATRIRDDFRKAVKLDPHNSDARFALFDYYMQAPRVVGGGKARAHALAAKTEAVNPAAAQLMQAQFALADKDYAKAEAALLAVQLGADGMVADRQHALLASLGEHYRAAGRQDDGERILRILRHPGSEAAP